MATAYAFSSLVPDSSFPAKWSPGVDYCIEFQYTLAGAVVTGDTYTTPANALPSNGIRILETQLVYTSLDTNATPTATISVGDSGAATRFINAANAGNATAYQISQFINQAQALTSGVVTTGTNYLYNNGTAPRLVVTVGGTVATAATTGVIRLIVFYRCVEEN